MALTGRNEHALKEVLSMIESSGGEASGFPGDITNDRHVKVRYRRRRPRFSIRLRFVDSNAQHRISCPRLSTVSEVSTY